MCDPMDQRGRRGHSLFGSCFFSKIKERKKKIGHGEGAECRSLLWVHMCTPLKPNRQIQTGPKDSRVFCSCRATILWDQLLQHPAGRD